tara:strand:+ start:219 stop:329 length:111 start_codon:yes stop_codon:yes gene_type:complete
MLSQKMNIIIYDAGGGQLEILDAKSKMRLLELLMMD